MTELMAADGIFAEASSGRCGPPAGPDSQFGFESGIVFMVLAVGACGALTLHVHHWLFCYGKH